MRDYMKNLRRYTVTVTAGDNQTATTFKDQFWTLSAPAAQEAARRKWHGAAIGAVSLGGKVVLGPLDEA